MTGIEDLVVVGGGIVGMLVAALARLRHPDWRIRIVERSLLGHGATAYSAGLMPFEGQTAAAREMAARARQGYAALRRHGLELPETQVAARWVVPAAQHKSLEERCGRPLAPLPRDGYRPACTTSPVPLLAAGEVVLDGGSVARLDAPAALMALARWARERGVECCEGAAVRRISGGPVFAVDCSDGVSLFASRVVLATGPWLLLESLWAAARPVGQARTKKIVVFHVTPAPPPDACLILFPEDDVFLLPVPEQGRWLLSVPSQTWDWLPDDRSLSPADLDLARAFMANRFPCWEAQVSGASVFGDGYTPDRQPVVQRLARSLVRVGCCSGSGVRLGPALAEEALEKLS